MNKLKYMNLINQYGGETLNVLCKTLQGVSIFINLTRYVDDIQEIKRKIAIAYRERMSELKQPTNVSITPSNIRWIIAGVSITVMTNEIYDRLPYINTTHVVLSRNPSVEEKNLGSIVVDAKNSGNGETVHTMMRRFVDNYDNFTRMKTILENQRRLSSSMTEEKKQLYQCLRNVYFRYEDIPADAIRLLYDNKTQSQRYNNAKDEYKRIYKAAGKIIWDTLNSQIKSSIRQLNNESTFNFLLNMPYTYNHLFISGLEDQKQKQEDDLNTFMKEVVKNSLLEPTIERLLNEITTLSGMIENAKRLVVPLERSIIFSSLYSLGQITDECDPLIYNMCIQLL